jgi:hypothetical protein
MIGPSRLVIEKESHPRRSALAAANISSAAAKSAERTFFAGFK